MRPIEHEKIPPPANVDPGPAPMLQWIEIERLVVDEAYQRPLYARNVQAIQRIAEAFCWAKFATVHVAPIEGGLFAIVDGQHRTHAAAACGMKSVPCQVIQMTAREQAQAFTAINGVATAVQPLHLYRAALAAGEAWAHELGRTCELAGCRMMTGTRSTDDKQPREIYAITTVRRAIAQHGAPAVTAALKAIGDAPGYGGKPIVWGNPYLGAAIHAIASRPRLHDDGVGAFFDRFDVFRAADEARVYIGDRRQRGLAAIPMHEYLEALIGDALDKAFAARIAVPSASFGSSRSASAC